VAKGECSDEFWGAIGVRIINSCADNQTKPNLGTQGHRMSEIQTNSAPALPAGNTEPSDDFALFQVLKPYIGHCLTMNHDINNPLAGILGYAEFMLSEPETLNEDQQKQLKKIYQCAERIKKLVENLCEEKIALSEKYDFRAITESYKKVAKELK
jgi:signal transduction histidine kinase